MIEAADLDDFHQLEWCYRRVVVTVRADPTAVRSLGRSSSAAGNANASDAAVDAITLIQLNELTLSTAFARHLSSRIKHVQNIFDAVLEHPHNAARNCNKSSK